MKSTPKAKRLPKPTKDAPEKKRRTQDEAAQDAKHRVIRKKVVGSYARRSRVMAAADGAHVKQIKPRMELRALAAPGQQELLIYGDIGESWFEESVTAQAVVQQLAELDQNTTQINVRINSYGGSVSDGMAIYNVLKRTAAKKVGTVDGVAMSSASLIAMACDDLEMPSTSVLMIHAPWAMAEGNANDMRMAADVLDTYAQSMAGAYSARSGLSAADVVAQLFDGQDHYYTGEQAVAAGFADRLTAVVPATPTVELETVAAATRTADRPRGFDRFLSRTTASIGAIAIAAARRPPIHAAAAAAIPAGDTPAVRVPSDHEDTVMPNAAAAQPANNAAVDTPAASAARPNETEIRAAAHAAVRERNTAIQATLKPVMTLAGMRELYEQALTDPDMSLDQVNAKALALAGAGAGPLAGGGGSVQAGEDESEKQNAAMADWIVARALAKGEDGKHAIANADPTNPYRGMSLSAMAEHCVRASGKKTARLTRNEVVGLAMQRPVAVAGHTTSDFPGLLGNIINRLLLATYVAANNKWQTFSRITDLADFRPNQRLRMGSFDDLLAVNEAGNYEQGSLGDATVETIKATRKGRKLVISREMIANDDLQAFADVATLLGSAAARTVEKDVFGLLLLNGGNGPTMGDGNPLFDASHNNIAAVAGPPSVTAFDLVRQQLAAQLDNSGKDFLDITPSIWLGPNSLYGLAQLLNINETDPSVTNKYQVANIVRAMLDKVVGTPRLGGTAWYILGNPEEQPVFEVGFVDGQRTPKIDQEVDFDSDGIKWKVVLEYGVAATGYRGIVKNAGA